MVKILSGHPVVLPKKMAKLQRGEGATSQVTNGANKPPKSSVCVLKSIYFTNSLKCFS